jgi:hypothetical protein
MTTLTESQKLIAKIEKIQEISNTLNAQLQDSFRQQFIVHQVYQNLMEQMKQMKQMNQRGGNKRNLTKKRGQRGGSMDKISIILMFLLKIQIVHSQIEFQSFRTTAPVITVDLTSPQETLGESVVPSKSKVRKLPYRSPVETSMSAPFETPSIMSNLIPYIPLNVFSKQDYSYHEMKLIINQINRMYVDFSKNISQVPVIAQLQQTCENIFNHHDTELLYKEMYKDANEGVYDAKYLGKKQLCSESLPLPQLSLNETTSTVVLHISQKRSYNDLIQEFDVLLRELSESVALTSKATLENEIQKMQYISKVVQDIINQFKYRESALQKVQYASIYIVKYYEKYLKLKDKSISPIVLAKVEEELNRMATDTEIRNRRSEMTKSNTMAVVDNILVYLSAPLMSLSGAAGDVGAKVGDDAARVINTFVYGIAGSLGILLTAMWGYRNFRKATTSSSRQMETETPVPDQQAKVVELLMEQNRMLMNMIQSQPRLMDAQSAPPDSSSTTLLLNDTPSEPSNKRTTRSMRRKLLDNFRGK